LWIQEAPGKHTFRSRFLTAQCIGKPDCWIFQSNINENVRSFFLQADGSAWLSSFCDAHGSRQLWDFHSSEVMENFSLASWHKVGRPVGNGFNFGAGLPSLKNLSAFASYLLTLSHDKFLQ